MREFELDGDWILVLGEMPRVCEWLEAHKLDPKRVPMQTTLLLDETTDEWVLDLYTTPVRIRPGTDEVVFVRVRRRVVSFPEKAWVRGWPK